MFSVERAPASKPVWTIELFRLKDPAGDVWTGEGDWTPCVNDAPLSRAEASDRMRVMRMEFPEARFRIWPYIERVSHA